MKHLNKHNSHPFDVIVVLGAAVWEGYRPSPALKRRLLHGVRLMKEGKADYLLVTGGLGKHPPTEANMMKQLAISEGIPAEKIITEEKGTTTFTNVVECVRIMRNNNWLAPIVVSDDYHLFRTKFVFRCFGIQAVGSGTTVRKGAISTWERIFYYLREWLALPWYLLLIMKTKLHIK